MEELGSKGISIYHSLVITEASDANDHGAPHYSFWGEVTADGMQRLYELAIGMHRFEGGFVRLKVNALGGRRERLASEVRRKLLPLASHGIAVEVFV